MTKRVTTSICIAAAAVSWSVAPSAQAPENRGQTETRQPQSQGRQTTGTVSLIGCVQQGATPAAFVLNVKEQPTATATQQRGSRTPDQQQQSRTQPGQSQATGTAGADLVGQRVQLIGSGRTNLREHSGHEVEVTGTMVPQGTAQGRTGQQSAAGMRLNVQNVRHIAPTCTPATGTRGTSGIADPETGSTPQPATPEPQPDAPEPQPTPDPKSTPDPYPEPRQDR